MSDHKWRKDADGAESCEREGCSVKHQGLAGLGIWQRKHRGHWRSETREPIPPCTSKDAAPEAKADPLRPIPGFGMPPPVVLAAIQEKRTAPAPYTLEVVREALETFQNMGGTVWASERKMAVDGLRALATLEESIRADERRKVGDELERRSHPVTSMAVRNM